MNYSNPQRAGEIFYLIEVIFDAYVISRNLNSLWNNNTSGIMCPAGTASNSRQVLMPPLIAVSFQISVGYSLPETLLCVWLFMVREQPYRMIADSPSSSLRNSHMND